MELLEKIQTILEETRTALSSAKNEADIEAVRAGTIGRNGSFTALGPLMGKVPPEQKREAGIAFNQGKQSINTMLEEAREKIADASAADVEALDVTLPGRSPKVGRMHPVSRTFEECCGIFRRMGFIATSGPEIETIFNNFDALNAPPDHPSRSPQDTFFFEDGRILRSHTSPVQIRTMLSQKPPVRIVAPGRCYRRDTPDATHGVHFHQIEGLYIDKDVSLADLKSTLMAFAAEFFGEKVKVRMRPSFFPFTEPSVECDFTCVMCGGKGCPVCKHSGWIECAGAGMVNPNVLRNVGYDPETCQGFAFGMGIERLTMIKHRIEDLRMFSDNDVRFLAQF